jgi:N-acetyl-D-muramate 6-phosphate phosphatase
MNSLAYQAILFDLDGTLADTAQDLSEPINRMRERRGLQAMPLHLLRPHASAGARGLLAAGFGIGKEASEFAAMRDEFLGLYERDMMVHTRLFEGMAAVLSSIEASGLPWGVVSNKVERYVRPIVAALGLQERCAVAVGGDTTAHAKPHPEPLLYACRQIGVDPAACLYVGDDLRDIQAGRSAGMKTVAAAYGYCGEHDPPQAWGADYLVSRAEDLQKICLHSDGT